MLAVLCVFLEAGLFVGWKGQIYCEEHIERLLGKRGALVRHCSLMYLFRYVMSYEQRRVRSHDLMDLLFCKIHLCQ